MFVFKRSNRIADAVLKDEQFSTTHLRKLKMNRRSFIGTFAAVIAATKFSGTSLVYGKDSPQIAITLDDFNLFDAPVLSAEQRNRAILEAFRARNLKSAIFVAGKFVDSETRRDYLKAWSAAGHIIANHTYSHFYYPKTSFETFSGDVLRGEAVIKDFRNFQKLFRFPYLKEGDTAQKRDQMRQFLKTNDYRNGYVTIDASDWYVDNRLRERLTKEPNALLAPYKAFYLGHLWERAKYYDELSQKVLGRSVKHNLLLHHNVINGLFLADVLRMFTEKGWKLIDASEAFTDSVYSAEPNILPAGESLIWALAKESKKFEQELRYPAEDGEYEKARMDALGL